MFRAPGHTPPLATLLDDLATRDTARIARHLDVSPRTLHRWTLADDAPRAVLLALFWETRWGASTIDSDLHNAAAVHRAHAAALQSECATLRTRIARLEAIGNFGAANLPSWRAG